MRLTDAFEAAESAESAVKPSAEGFANGAVLQMSRVNWKVTVEAQKECMNRRAINPKAWSAAGEKKEIIRMVLPLILDYSLTYVIASINQIILNKFSSNAVAATTAVSMFVSLMVNMYTLFYVGQSIFLAPCWGRKSYQEGSRFWSVSIVDNVAVGLLIGIVGIFGSSFVMTALKVPQELRQMAGNYLHITLGLCVFQGVALTCTTAFRAIGYMKVSMIGNVLINGSCVAIEALIYFLVPKEKQCIEQYAMAGVIAQFLGVSYYLWTAYKDEKIELHFFDADFKKYFGRFSGKMFRLGMLGGMEGVIYQICQNVVMAMIAKLGVDALAAKGYATNLVNYVMVPCGVLSILASTVVGMSIGVGDEKKADKCVVRSIWISMGANAVMDLIALAIARPFMSLYTKDEALLALCIQVLIVNFVAEFLRCFASVMIVSLKAIGDVVTPFRMIIVGSILNILVSWLFGIYLNFGVAGICVGYCADLGYRGVAGLIVWKRRVARHDYPVLGKNGLMTEEMNQGV